MATSPTPAHTTPRHVALETIAPYAVDTGARAVKLFRNGANQAVRIPKEFELPGTDALIHREGNRLILELVPDRPKKGTAAALLAALDSMKDWEPITEEFPDVDAGMLPLDDIDFGDDAK
jgi:antitoxin VapB